MQLKKPKQYYFKYFEGTQGVRSMFLEFIDNLEEKSTVYICSSPIAYKRWNVFFLDYFHPTRIEKKITLKLTIPKTHKKHGEERISLPQTEIVYTDEEYPAEFGVCGDYTYILSEGDKPYAMMYKDENFAQMQKMVFEKIWDQAKKE